MQLTVRGGPTGDDDDGGTEQKRDVSSAGETPFIQLAQCYTSARLLLHRLPVQSAQINDLQQKVILTHTKKPRLTMRDLNMMKVG